MKFCDALRIVLAALVIGSPLALCFEAPSNRGSVTVVSHVDIIPSAFKPGSEESAARLLRAQEAATQHDAGLMSFAILQQENGTNHFTVVETWRDARSYEMHQGAAHTVQFRNDLQPLLGSPFDARVHRLFR